MTLSEITLAGWVRVHTYNESHGASRTDFLQREEDRLHAGGWHGPSVLALTRHRDRTQHPDGIRIEGDKDYLLASQIRASLKATPGRWASKADRYISPCYTMGCDDYYDAIADQHYRVTSVAGHGEWAARITEADYEGGVR